jgi:predicted ATPase
MSSIHANLPIPERIVLMRDTRGPQDALGWRHVGDLAVGPITVLLGGNGSGKSSIIRLLARTLTGRYEGLAGIDLGWCCAVRGPQDVQDLLSGIDLASVDGLTQPNWFDGGEFIFNVTRAPDGSPTYGTGMMLRGGTFDLDAGDDEQPWSGPADALPFGHRVLAFGPSIGSIDDLAGQALQLTGAIGTSHWPAYGVKQTGLSGDGQPTPEVLGRARLIGERLNRVVPDFLGRLGYYSVVPNSAVDALDSGRRSYVALDRPDGTTIDANDLSSAQRRWLEISLSVAAAGLHCPCENFTEDGQTMGPPDNPVQLLVLIDEPELHLHPFAQADVVVWINRMAALGIRFVVATHSARLLTVDPTLSTFVRVDRDAEAPISVISADALSVIDDFGDALGMGRDALYAALGGVILVEGLDDQRVLEHFYGGELRRRRLLVLPIDGHKNASNAATAELIARLGVPLHLLLDKLDGGSSDEQRTADRFVARLRSLGRPATTIDFGGPDILTGISLQSIVDVWPHEAKAIRALAPDYEWGSALEAYAAEMPVQNFKTWFIEKLGRNPAKATLAMRDLIDKIAATPDAAPSAELEGAMQRFFAEPHHDSQL